MNQTHYCIVKHDILHVRNYIFCLTFVISYRRSVMGTDKKKPRLLGATTSYRPFFVHYIKGHIGHKT